MIRAVVFDFDGLIVDTETPWFYVYRDLFRELGGDLPLEEWVKVVGSSFEIADPFHHLEKAIGRKVDRMAIQREAAERYKALPLSVRPGVEAYLHSARESGFKIGLASSSDRAWVEGYLKRFGLLSYFDVIRTRDDVRRIKPDPELYVAALSGLGVAAGEALAFEDSLNGLRAAAAAGLRCVVVPNEVTAGLPFEGHVLRLQSMAERPLAEVVAMVFGVDQTLIDTR